MTSWTFGATSANSRAVTHAWVPDWKGNLRRACYLRPGLDPERRVTELVYATERVRTAVLLMMREHPEVLLCSKCDKNNGYGGHRYELLDVIIEFGALTGQDPIELTHTMAGELTVGELDRLAVKLGIDNDAAWQRWLRTRPPRAR
jgi:hypothetical protein